MDDSGISEIFPCSSNIWLAYICDVSGPGEFPTQRPVTRSFEVYFDLRLNKRL